MSNMPEYDIESLESNAERIDGQVEDIREAIKREVEAKAAHDNTIMALDAGIKRLQGDAKNLRRLAEEIRQAEMEKMSRGDSDDRQAGDADNTRHG